MSDLSVGSRSTKLKSVNSTPSRRKSSRNNPDVFMKNELASATKINKSVSISTIAKERVWDPPYSCQRKQQVQSNNGNIAQDNTDYTVYFPIELTNKDYLYRVISVIFTYFKHLINSSNIDTLIGSNDVRDTFAEEFKISSSHSAHAINTAGYQDERFLQIIFMNHISSLPFISNSQKLIRGAQLHNSSGFDEYLNATRKFVSYFDQSIDPYELDCGKLKNISEIFECSKSILKFILFDDLPIYNKSLRDLEELESQMKIHKIFKDQRMVAMGWKWKPELLEVGNNFITDDQSVDSNFSTQKPLTLRRAFNQYLDIKTKIMSILEPVNTSLVHLVTRFFGVVEDLNTLCNALADDSEYTEAHRLRQLSSAIEHSIDRASIAYTDNSSLIYKDGQNLIVDLMTLSASIRSNANPSVADNDYYDLQKIDSAIRDLTHLCELLSVIFSQFSFFKEMNVLKTIAVNGSTEFLTADFIFLTPHQCDNQSFGGLVIKSQSESFLSSIREWPNLTSLNQNQYKFKSPAPLTNSFYSNNSSFSPVNSPLTPSSNTNIKSNQNVRHSYPPQIPSHNMMNSTDPPQFQQTSSSNNRNRLTIEALRNQYGQNSNLEYNNNDENDSMNDRTETTSLNSFTYSVKSKNSYAHSHLSQQSHSRNSRAQSPSAITSTTNRLFDPEIMNILFSFEDIQKHMVDLLYPHSVALTQLICRLIGMHRNLHSLSEVNILSRQYNESERLLKIAQVMEATIDSDEMDEDIIGGRGRKRIDNINHVLYQVQEALQELYNYASKAKNEHDFTGASALESLANELRLQMSTLEKSISPYSMLDDEDDDLSHNFGDYVISAEIGERIAREGSHFVTSDFIFQYSGGNISVGQSIGSLAILAGAGGILRYIKKNWPYFTALGNDMSSGLNIDQPSKFAFGENSRNNNNSIVKQTLNFESAAELRLMGFDPTTLKAAGFSEIDILTAGFTVFQLKEAGFSTSSMVNAGLTDNTIRSVGFHTEQLTEALCKLFKETSGSQWKDSSGWKEMNNIFTAGKVAMKGGNINSMSQYLHNHVLFGIKYDSSAGEIIKLNLMQNSLKGVLSDGIGTLIGLKQLVLSENNLKGPIPSSIGCLTNLEILFLNHNELEGEIPKSLKNLQNLTVLRLDNNQLTGFIPSSLGILLSLKRLDLSYNRLSGPIPKRLGNLPNVNEILLHHNQLYGSIPESFGNLMNLSSLLINNNKLSGIIPNSISKLTRLTCLNIKDNEGFEGMMM
eukprot:gene7983-10826_t